MTLTPECVKIISERPLLDTLATFRNRFRRGDDLLREDVAGLLGALLGTPASFSLPLPDEAGSVAVKLFSILQCLREGSVNLDLFQPLVHNVADESPDETLWATVFDLIDTLGALPHPPSSITPTFKGTPIKSSSSRLDDSETRNIVERELFFEIKDCTFRNVGGFWTKFFNPENWAKEQKSMMEAIMTTHDGARWEDFPATTDERPIWDWFRMLEERFLSGAAYKLYTTQSANQFKERKGQMDIFFQAPGTTLKGFKHKYVLVVGEQKKSYNPSRFKADLLQLARYVRGIFTDQPTRRFVHAFSLCSAIMELWIFDRSGLYSSGPFNIHDEPGKFARALVGYATMDDDAMGLGTFIERQGAQRYVTVEDANKNDKRVELKKAMVRQRAIVCRGTTCYGTAEGHVAKFSWASDKRKLEIEQMRRAEQRGVQGVSRVVAYRQITTIAAMREGLVFPKPHHFQEGPIEFGDLPVTSTNTSSSSNKRKSSSDHSSGHTSDPKKRRPQARKSRPSAEQRGQASLSKVGPSLYEPSMEPWENRIHSCLIVSPAGPVISSFKSSKVLLESMRDAIKAHQSLYTIGNILHRDISSNNIIITRPEDADGFKGVLIDLDLAKEIDSSPSGARHQTGTMQFMAVEVLRKTDHTYRHDLESFFYVLIWMCARQSWDNGFGGDRKKPRMSLLRKWEIGRFEDIAREKVGHMTVNCMNDIMGEFPAALDCLKPLCLKIRSILFGDAASLVLGTPAGDPDQLYRPIIAAYDDAIRDL